jgi:Fuc2NAc and GlcNAc transferase
MIKKSLVSTVTERSSHTVPTPHGGGIAVAITWFIGLIYLYLNEQINSVLFFALIIGAIIAVVGLIDDIVELSPKTRMTIFILVGIMGLYIIGGLKILTLGLFDIYNPIITSAFAILLILWYINLTNFIDGINGYLGTKFLFLGFAGFLLFSDSHFLILIVAILGFLYWNFGKAKIFFDKV